MARANEVVAIPTDELMQMEALLDDLQLADTIDEIIDDGHADTTTPAAVEPQELDDEALAKLDATLTRATIYEEQESTIAAPDTSAVDPAAKPAKKALAPKAAGAAPSTRVPRAPRDLNAVAGEFFVLEGDPKGYDDAQLAANMTQVLTLKPSQKKIGEKFDNLFLSLSVGRKPSTFVMDAFALLDAKKSLTTTDMVAAFKADGYDDGTARSQVGQIMTLFDVVKIASRDSRSTLTLNPKSTIADRLRAL